MKIRVYEINEEGKNYAFDEKSGELNESFSELTKEPYQVDLHISDRGSFYQVKGSLSANTKNICSKCGDDISLPLETQFSDMVIEKPNNPRGSQYSKGKDVENSESTEVSYHEGGIFDLGEYLREQLALQIPLYPECGGGCSSWEETKGYIKKINKESESFHVEKGHPGFDALKDLKLN